MPLSRPAQASGFTLIELMLGIAVLVILLTLSMPSFQTWMQNIQIRNASESILTGIQKARSEAVTRNTSVSFVMGADSSWTVNVVNPASVIETRPASDGSQSVTRTVLPAGAATVTFNNFGVVTANADATATLTQLDFSAPGGNRNMRITIGVGGNAKMCDPSLPSGSGPSAC
jgi:type IV fimbrial biogenesis protein FimT